MKTSIKKIFFAVSCIFSLGACAEVSNGAKAVSPFELNKYLGKWYEIARFDMRFERNLINVTATYSMNENGTVKVLNAGFDTVKNVWKQAIGKAKFAGNTNEARLKVSFFGPFYAPYNVIALDDEYQYALVVGNNFKYMWFLAREKNNARRSEGTILIVSTQLGFRCR
jgi:apolipoprotein D and lipocalin family protein